MSDIDIRYFYDCVKYIKDIEPKLFTKIKKIRSLKKEKNKYSNRVDIKYLDQKNNKYYSLVQKDKKITLSETDKTKTKTKTIISASLDMVTKTDIMIEIPNNDIMNNTIYSLYCLSDKTKKEYIGIVGELTSLYNHFKLKPKNRFLDSETDQQILSLFLTYNSSYPALMSCLENEINELNDETFTYLMFKLMANGDI